MSYIYQVVSPERQRWLKYPIYEFWTKCSQSRNKFFHGCTWNFGLVNTVNYLLVAADEKQYSHMVQLISEYGEALDWASDILWGFSFNVHLPGSSYVCFLGCSIKANCCVQQFPGWTRTILSRCSNFTTTTTFPFEVWEAPHHQHIQKWNNKLTNTTETLWWILWLCLIHSLEGIKDEIWANSFLETAQYFWHCT